MLKMYRKSKSCQPVTEIESWEIHDLVYAFDSKSIKVFPLISMGLISDLKCKFTLNRLAHRREWSDIQFP